jgi:hypothetical protein
MSFDHIKQINPQVAALNYNQQLIVAQTTTSIPFEADFQRELGTSSTSKQSSDF